MKNLMNTVLLFTALIFVTPVHAGPGHSHDADGGHSNYGHSGPISADKAKSKAERTMHNLAKRGVIDKSWTSTKPVNAEIKNYAKGKEWVVTFKNEQIEEKSKQTLYIFYSIDGHYMAANYTGK